MPPRVEDAVAKLEEAHKEFENGATTGLRSWDGRTPEYAWCVEAVFNQPKNRASKCQARASDEDLSAGFSGAATGRPSSA